MRQRSLEWQLSVVAISPDSATARCCCNWPPGSGVQAIVALQAKHLRFVEAGLAIPVSGHDGAPQTRHLPPSAAPASCPVRALADWLRVSVTRYGPVFRKVNRWGQLEHAALVADGIRLILV